MKIKNPWLLKIDEEHYDENADFDDEDNDDWSDEEEEDDFE